jgi:hypothetical protein
VAGLRPVNQPFKETSMKKTVIALLMIFGVSVAGSALACESGHDKDKSGTMPPAATTK